MKHHLERFFARLAPVLRQPDVARAAREAGIHQWSADQLPGVSERSGFADLGTGEGVTTTFFIPATAPPPSYPDDLPWLPLAVTTLAEFTFGGAVMRSVSWGEAPGLREAAEGVIEWHVAAGWAHCEPTQEIDHGPGAVEVLAWLSFRGRVRVISYAAASEYDILQLIDLAAPAPDAGHERLRGS